MLKSDMTRFPESVELITEIEHGITNDVNKSYIRKLQKLGKMFEGKKPQIEVGKYCLFEWWVIEGSDKKPYLCGMSSAGCGNMSFVIDCKLNIIKEMFYGNLHRDTPDDYENIIAYINRYE